MIFTPTQINEQKIDDWKQRLPKRLHIFLDNFFGTCPRSLSPAENYSNYLNDIMLYRRTTRAYRENADQLQEAFYDITGWCPEARW